MVAVRAIEGTEPAPDEDPTIRLQRDRTNAVIRTGAWIEAAVQAPICIEPSDSVPVCAIDGREIAPNEHLPIRLQCNSTAKGIWACPRIEVAVRGSIGVEPGDADKACTICQGEIPTDEHLAIRL